MFVQACLVGPGLPLASSSLTRNLPASSPVTGSMLKAAMTPSSVASSLLLWNLRAICSWTSFNVVAASAAAAGGAAARGFLGAGCASLSASLVISLIFFEPPLRRDIFDVGARASFANEMRAAWSGASFLRRAWLRNSPRGTGAALRSWQLIGSARPPAQRLSSLQAATRGKAVSGRCCEDARW